MALTEPGRSHRSHLATALSLFVVLLMLPLGVAPAAADPAPDIETVRKRVEQLDRKAAEATESYNAAREKLASITVAVKAADVRVVQQQVRVERARQALGRLAAETYKSGDLNGLLLLLDDDPQALLAASGLRSSLGERKARGVAALLAEQEQLDADRGALAEQKRELGETRTRLAGAKKTVEDKLSQSKALLARLDGEQRRALQQVSRSMDGDALADLGVKVSADGRLDCDGVGIKAPNTRAAKAIAFACAQLGKPYRWGGGGPGSYDCSGLTQASWAAAGVSLPHNAGMQVGYGTRVSAGTLQPGDLVFFYSPISHNGIYIGKGLMIHAPRTGDVIRIASARLDGRLTAAVRL